MSPFCLGRQLSAVCLQPFRGKVAEWLMSSGLKMWISYVEVFKSLLDSGCMDLLTGLPRARQEGFIVLLPLRARPLATS